MIRLPNISLVLVFIVTVAATLCLPSVSRALEPPPPGMLAEMQRNGTLTKAQARAKELGNYQMHLPKRGVGLPANTGSADIAVQVMTHFGESLNAPKSGKAVSDMSQADLSFAQFDLNHDRVVDERDVLTLGFAGPKETASLPAMGTAKAFCLFIDFPDYPRWFDNNGSNELDFRLFDQGDSNVNYHSLQWYYQQASYGDLTIEGSVYHHRASQNRAYYHPNDNNSYSTDTPRRSELLAEALQAANAAGEDFTQYDNDGDGKVDYYMVVYCGPVGAWSSYWWGYNYINGYPLNLSLDGVSFNGAVMTWEWEQYYAFDGTPPNPQYYTPYVAIHETGHALGLPDLYDYDANQGPDGGVGGLDMMASNWGDQGCFNKYVLGWIAPTTAFTNLNDEALDKSSSARDAVVFMPGFDPVSPWSEYFMAQYRCREGVDSNYPADGMLLWHIDARVNGQNGNFNWNNSYTAHKLVRLMEADGLEEIETGDGQADAADFYQTGNTLSPTSTPNSNKYDGSNPGITCNDFSAPGTQMTADFNMYTSNPPSVNITAPGAGSTVSGNSVNVTVSATDDQSVSKVQLLIDGRLVKTWAPWSNPSTYVWNTLVDFNKTLSITARAWDAGNQVGSSIISVTVSNTGVTSVTDSFESDLVNWRVVNYPEEPLGSFTQWNARTSPRSPPSPGSGKEAWVEPPLDGVVYRAYDALRSQRINATAYTFAPRVKFFYRCNAGFELRATTDNGSSWTKLATISASTKKWATYDSRFATLQNQTFYLALFYSGTVQSNSSNGLGANIDNFSCGQ